MVENDADAGAPRAHSYPRYLAAPPAGFFWVWAASAVAAAAALILLYGFREPPLDPRRIRSILILSLSLFTMSRLLLFVPISAFGPRLKTWWVDFVLIIAAVVWWVMRPQAEPVILKIAAIYTLVIGAGVLARAIVLAFVDEFVHRGLSRATLKLFTGSLIICLIGGAMLVLPVCWAKPVTGEKAAQEAKHVINCLFTATAAFTGTGLAVNEIQEEFTRAGQIVILILMQIGGLAVLILGSLAAWRFHSIMGWNESELTQGTLIRLVRFVCVLAIFCEALGGALLYQFWEPAAAGETDRILNAAFHTVSGFCNVGLTLPNDGLIGQARPQIGVMAILSVLMLVGTLGAPVFYDLLRGHRRDACATPSKPTRVTVMGICLLVVIGAGLLVAIESTPRWQLRNPREDIPGRLRMTGGEAAEGTLVFSAQDTQRSRSERLRTMPLADRSVSALFTSISALGGGMSVVRLDEQSLAPASRIVLSIWMLIGGGVGGTAGGIRIVIVYLLLSAVFGKGSSTLSDPPLPPLVKGGDGGVVAAVAGGMLLLVTMATLLLAYRETGSLEACAFEAISASCNVGLSTGLTPRLSPEARVVLVLAMLLGKAIPLGIIFRRK